MSRLLALLLLVASCSTLSALVAGGAGEPLRRNPEEEGQARQAKAPAWIADPTEGGKTRGAVASWPALASKAEQKSARAAAIEKLLASLKLPASTRVKEMNLWVDVDGKTYVHLIAR